MSLGARLALVFAAVAAITALTVGGAAFISTDRQVSSEIDRFLRERATEIAEGQRIRPQARGDGVARGRGRIIAVSADAEVQILAADGRVISNTDLLLPVDEADIGLASGVGSPAISIRTATIDGQDYRIFTRSLQPVGAIQVARSLQESDDLLEDLQARLGVITIVAALVAAAIGWMLAQRTTRPLRSLTAAVDEVAETQDFSVPVPTSGNGEVGRLGSGFNRMLAALQQSEEQQRRLVQDAAHELRTPLTSVTANLDWLERASDLDDETRTATLGSVRREVDELNNVITEIIQLATDSREEPTLVRTDLAPVVQEAVSLFRERTDRTVNVNAETAQVIADVDGVGRAVANLLSNADKYSPADAPIGVTVSPAGIYVDDAGPGIPEAEREMVFDRFYRRDEDRAMAGSGLGLSIVASIVEQHGGLLHVSTSPLGGARVGFSLPPG